jgi:hypothetical protein
VTCEGTGYCSIELAGHALGEGDDKVKTLYLTIRSCFSSIWVCNARLKHAVAARCTVRVVPGGGGGGC